MEEYITTHLTDAAIDWIDDQNQPWFLWLAHIAPHSPFQVPPADLHTVNNPTTDRQMFNAMVEALDTEIGRLLNSMDEETRENTIVVFVGDNGSPNTVLRGFTNGHGKGSLYEGGVGVPMIVSGAGVTRRGVEEFGLTQANDLHATFIETCSNPLPGGIHNSYSILSSFTEDNAIERNCIYADVTRDAGQQWAIRNQEYKYIEDEQGNQEFYRVDTSIEEVDNLISNLTAEEAEILADLQKEADAIRNGWSCRDFILNGEEETIDDCQDVSSTHNLEKAIINIFPNPGSDVINIEVEGRLSYRVSLYDLGGKLMQNVVNADNLRVGELVSGMYLLELEDLESGKKLVERIVIGN